MTDKELQDLIRLKKYEQPEEGYFDDFLVEFQQRQRSEMLKTSARGLLLERVKAWFSELGSMRWVVGAGAAYAAVAVVLHVMASEVAVDPGMASSVDVIEDVVGSSAVVDADYDDTFTVSMVFADPVDFSSPSPAFSVDEKIF